MLHKYHKYGDHYYTKVLNTTITIMIHDHLNLNHEIRVNSQSSSVRLSLPDPGLEQLYGRALVEFRQLAKQTDPEGKFCNEQLVPIQKVLEHFCFEKDTVLQNNFQSESLSPGRWVQQTIGDYTVPMSAL